MNVEKTTVSFWGNFAVVEGSVIGRIHINKTFTDGLTGKVKYSFIVEPNRRGVKRYYGQTFAGSNKATIQAYKS